MFCPFDGYFIKYPLSIYRSLYYYEIIRRKKMGKTIFLNRIFIILLLLVFITIYAFFYERSYTFISSLYGELEDVFNTNFNEAELSKVYDFFQTINSMYFQIPVQFINTLFNLYVTSFILYIGLK